MDPETGWITPSEEQRRLVGLWTADCAERVLPLFEAKAPSDSRPREAIAGIRAFARGEKRAGQLRPLVWAAYAAARDVGDPVAAAAARAAGCAAATDSIHARATPHQEKHVLGSAMYGARARELSSVDDAAQGNEEIRWAIEHASPAVREVVRRMPVHNPGRTRLSALLYQLHVGVCRLPRCVAGAATTCAAVHCTPAIATGNARLNRFACCLMCRRSRCSSVNGALQRWRG
jgi:hypothetical protein